MYEVKNSIVSSTLQYLNKLQYLARDDKKTALDIMLLAITDEVYDWSAYNNDLQSNQEKLQKLRKEIIRNNSNLIEPIYRTDQYYKNVNLPQTLYTWQRVYDASNLVTVDPIIP